MGEKISNKSACRSSVSPCVICAFCKSPHPFTPYRISNHYNRKSGSLKHRQPHGYEPSTSTHLHVKIFAESSSNTALCGLSWHDCQPHSHVQYADALYFCAKHRDAKWTTDNAKRDTGNTPVARGPFPRGRCIPPGPSAGVPIGTGVAAGPLALEGAAAGGAAGFTLPAALAYENGA